jgi:hypothetical protein
VRPEDAPGGSGGPWRKLHVLGAFASEEEAAREYDLWVLFGGWVHLAAAWSTAARRLGALHGGGCKGRETHGHLALQAGSGMCMCKTRPG